MKRTVGALILGLLGVALTLPASLRSALEKAVDLDAPVLIHVDFPLLAPPFQLVNE